MRIMLVNDFFAPHLIGGTESHMRVLLDGLRKQGHAVSVATARIHDSAIREVMDGIPVFRIGEFPGIDRTMRMASGTAPGRFSQTMRREFERILEDFQPDVVHFQNVWLLGPDIISVAGIRKGLSIHDYWPFCPRRSLIRVNWRECPGPEFISCRLCRLRAPATLASLDLLHIETERDRHTHLLASCDFLTAATRYVADRVNQAMGLSPTIVPYGIPVDAPEFLPGEEGAFVLFAGRVNKAKGYAVLLRAFRRKEMKGYTLYVAGNTASVKDANIKILGWQTPAQLFQLIARARCVVVPSIWPEPAGIVILEAMRAGVPVVASRIGGIPDVLEDGRTGILVPPDDPSALAKAIRLCCEEVTLRDSARRLGPQAIKDRFSLSLLLTRLESLYAG